MVRYISIILTGILLPAAAYAQHPGLPVLNRQVDQLSTVTWQGTGAILKGALADSLNKKKVGLTEALHDTNIPDRLSAAMPLQLNDSARQRFYNYLRNSSGTEKIGQWNNSLHAIRDKSRLTAYVDDKLRGFYALRKDIPGIDLLKKGAYNNNFKGFSAGAFYDNTPGAVATTGFDVNLEDELRLNNIPFHINYSNLSGQSRFADGLIDQSLIKFSFDKDAYLKRLSAIVDKNYDVNKYFLGDIDVATAVKSYTTKRIEAISEQLKSKLDTQQYDALKNLLSADQLIQLDSNQIRNLLLNNPALSSDEKAIRAYLDEVNSVKTEVNKGMAAKELLGKQLSAQNKVGDWLETASAKKQQIAALLPLNFLQKLLLAAKQLNFGQIAADGSKGGVSGLFMTGMQGTFLKNDKFLMLGGGKRQDGGNIKDIGLTESIDPGSYMMQFMEVGKGDADADHSHIAMVNANTKNSNVRQFDQQILPRNIFVGAFSERVSFGEYGDITAQLSKSSTQFNHSASGNEMALASKAAAFTLFDDFWQTLSIGLDYTGNVDKWKMNQRVYINYSGLGYSNPATPGAGRGSVKYGGSLKRSWQKNRISASVKADMQDIHTSALNSNKWQNRQYAVDTRFKVNRQLSLTAHLGQAVMKSISEHQPTTAFLTRQLSFTSQLNGRMVKMPYNSNIMLGVQQIDMLPLRSLLVNLNVNHNIIVNTHVLSVNVFYNKDVKENALYGNLLTMESAWTYQYGILNCSSGFTYLDNKDVVRQLGVKQTLTTQVLKKLNVNLYVDCRKNLINTNQNYLFGNFRSELSLQYLLN